MAESNGYQGDRIDRKEHQSFSDGTGAKNTDGSTYASCALRGWLE